MIKKYKKCHVVLESVISRQRYTNDKNGLGYSKFNKSSQIKETIFIKSSNAYNNIQPKKM